jgi:putative Holliday junction resolvase
VRVLGIDFGDRNIGLALSDPLGLTSQPLLTYRLVSPEEDARFFRSLVEKHDIGEVVIGLPVRLDGSPGRRVEKTQDFGRWLEETVRLPVAYFDERLTTRQALHIMRDQKVRSRDRRAVENQISASLILEAYLQVRGNKPHAS